MSVLTYPKKDATAAPRASDVYAKTLMQGKVLLVTGGGSGIGLGICKSFASLGAKVAICGRTEAKLQKAMEEIRQAGADDVMYRVCDVRNFASCEEVTRAVGVRWGKIDYLVNCAAGNFMCAAEDLSPKALATVIDIDLKGTFNMSKAALPELSRATGGACIINISATLQYTAMPFQAHAASAKAGIDVMTNTLGVEWAEYGIRCVGIAPGPVAGTEGGPTGRVFGSAIGGMKPSMLCPVGRFGAIDDIANAAVFLASPAGSWITSETLVVDGGAWHNAGMFLNQKKVIRSMVAKQREKHRKAKM